MNIRLDGNISAADEVGMSTQSSTEPPDFVSVVIPCYNEEQFIIQALERLADQYDKDFYEIIIVDGVSEDNTRAKIEEFRKAHPELLVRVIENPARNIPTALNIGISSARGDIIARMDAHAAPSEGYIRRCVEVLRQSSAGVVGMPCQIQPSAQSLIAKAIASAVSHPFGIGDAKYRLRTNGSLQESVDTVAFASFRRSLWVELGGYNEALLTNEDYDFNYRVRSLGRQVILDRSGHCEYFARATVKELAVQYWRYGRWKARMLRLHPRSIKPRHLAAPVFVLSIVSFSLLGVWSNVARWLLALELGIYLVMAVLAGVQVTLRNRDRVSMILLMPCIFFVIHSAWGSSFLLELIRSRPVAAGAGSHDMSSTAL